MKKKTCRICAQEDLHANFVNIFELTVNNVNGDAADEKISLFETMRQLTGIKVIFGFILSRLYNMRTCQRKFVRMKAKKRREKHLEFRLVPQQLNCFEEFKSNLFF